VKSGVTAQTGVDPRVELFGAIQLLARGASAPAGLEALVPAALRRHPAVTAHARLGEGEALGLIAQCLSADARLTWRRPRALLSEDFAAAFGGFAPLEEFLAHARDFARRARFFTRLTDAASAYADAVAAARRGLAAGLPQAAALERYLGAPLPARLRFVLGGLYTPGRYNAYIFPYPYPRPGELAPPPGPYEVITVLAPGRAAAGALAKPLEAGLLQELVYCWAEPFVWTHRAVLLGATPAPGLQHEFTRGLVEAISVRAAQKAGLAPGVKLRGAHARRASEALGGYEKSRARTLTAYGPALARALARTGAAA
jgi:hypothetical protein